MPRSRARETTLRVHKLDIPITQLQLPVIA